MKNKYFGFVNILFSIGGIFQIFSYNLVNSKLGDLVAFLDVDSNRVMKSMNLILILILSLLNFFVGVKLLSGNMEKMRKMSIVLIFLTIFLQPLFSMVLMFFNLGPIYSGLKN